MMVLWDSAAIALTTNHTLTVTPNILSERTKDDADAPAGDMDGYSWGMTSDSVVGTNDNVGSNERSIIQLAAKMLELSKLAVVSDAITPRTGGVPNTGWKESTDKTVYPESRGAAYIESLSITAGASGYASASVSFKGEGELS